MGKSKSCNTNIDVASCCGWCSLLGNEDRVARRSENIVLYRSVRTLYLPTKPRSQIETLVLVRISALTSPSLSNCSPGFLAIQNPRTLKFWTCLPTITHPANNSSAYRSRGGPTSVASYAAYLEIYSLDSPCPACNAPLPLADLYKTEPDLLPTHKSAAFHADHIP